jgi:NAD(P)-dependent dehydrogenase (short-subunit alcohol dehydrogenase family)
MGALDGKVAIVTGGTSGIGEAIAKAFVLEGAKVVIAGRRAEEGRALEKQIGVRFVRADVAEEADVKALVDRTLEWFGRLDCLVNNAGIPSPWSASLKSMCRPSIRSWRSTSGGSYSASSMRRA